MKLSVIIPALGLIAVTAGARDASAFETVTNDQFPSSILSTKLADPDDIVQNMSQRYTGRDATIFRSGNMTIGIVGPGGGFAAGESPFVADPAVGMVPSKRQW